MEKIRIVVVVGPTASGKSALVIELARLFDGEIVSADSMQVYRHMDIGTAKPSKAERGQIRHHLIDCVLPDASYSAARYNLDARAAIQDIDSRGKHAFVVGGTGLYIKTLLRGIFKGPGEDKELRSRLMKENEGRGGKQKLYERLKAFDPKAASTIHPNNSVRVIRALEVFELTERPISELQREHGFSQTPFRTLKIGLKKDKESRVRDIDQRAEQMMQSGLLEEVRGLIEMGFDAKTRPMQALGYRQMAAYLNNECTLDEAVELLKKNTRQYAKRQMTWFKKDRDIVWFSPLEREAIIDKVRGYFA